MFNKILVSLMIIFMAGGNAFAKRIPTPPVLTDPMDEDQIRKLNVYLSDVWFYMQGRYSLDIETSSRTSSDNGDMWLITGTTNGIQYRMNNQTYTVEPNYSE